MRSNFFNSFLFTRYLLSLRMVFILCDNISPSVLRMKVREKMVLRKKGRRPQDPNIRRAIEIGYIYWSLFRRIDWNDGELKEVLEEK